MTQTDLFNRVLAKAQSFGFKDGQNAIKRNNTVNDDYSDKAAWFGFILESEPASGAYQDLSFVVCPGNKEEVSECVVALSVGSLGYSADYELASRPGLRRRYLGLRNESNKNDFFIKNDFTDVTGTLSSLVKRVKGTSLENSISKYKTVMPAAEYISMTDETAALETIYRWLALYAELRDWGTNEHRKNRKSYLTASNNQLKSYEEEVKEIERLLRTHRFMVIQGAPGVGKTHTAMEIANLKKGGSKNGDEKYKVFFEQFHAETSYSDFIGGLMPKSDGGFEYQRGILLQAIDHANKNPQEDVLLIIDEINRANLANVLGPVFYLFENHARNRHNVEYSKGDVAIAKIPENLYVIATMNTADRSLAVVDFALRRRFIWYTLQPRTIVSPDFRDKDFKEFSAIFEDYATDEELDLQPGQSYFIADSEEQLNERYVYELMPLIKEYLREGFLAKAADDFTNFFFQKTGKLLFE